MFALSENGNFLKNSETVLGAKESSSSSVILSEFGISTVMVCFNETISSLN
jgi:hypothetical protein